jgi:RNA polymerase sigma-70 factor (ECF subfamily)
MDLFYLVSGTDETVHLSRVLGAARRKLVLDRPGSVAYDREPVAGVGETTGTRAVLYCLVPRDLGDKLHDSLREHFRAHQRVEVVVERRREDRRVSASRRGVAPAAGAGEAAERRRVRNAAGRRIADRRAIAAPAVERPDLPRVARRYADRLVFIERLEPSSQRLRDADSKRLVVRFQSGDEGAFGELYLRYFNAVYSYARVALSDHHEAEDVTQQVFMNALSSLDRYELRPAVPFRGWLFTIARNVIVREAKLRSGLVIDSPEQIELLQESRAGDQPRPNVAETLDWLTDREVAMFVERLPHAQRQVLVLRFMLDLSSEEIAQVLGRSSTSVRKLQSRALLSLQRRLAAVGRSSSEPGPVPVRRRVGFHTVMARRRFVLTRRPPGVAA